ncbi:reverse transcriptase domain-containing protein [Tanacetum coccineum]|uniref:Reverse transcriptase domain-containing protein n=1 Tax=Tanacetum coccineum TaxID=301880 RepID=A0ABQ5E5Z9_9ASTR
MRGIFYPLMHIFCTFYESADNLVASELVLDHHLLDRSEVNLKAKSYDKRKCPTLSAVKCFFSKTFSKSPNSSPWMHRRASNSKLVKPLSEPERTLNHTFMGLQTKLETTTKNHQALIQNLEEKFDRLADKQSGRPSGSLPSNTQPNLNVAHPNLINHRKLKMSIEDEEEESPKPVKETLVPKPYKPKIPYPQRLRKEKMEAKYGKFLDMIRDVRINVPLVDVFAGMPNYGKFIKELVSNKHKLEQISSAFLSDESSAMIQNKVPPKLEDPGSFLIPCTFNKAFSSNALADLGASINLMPYSLYAKLSFETLKPTKMSVRLADRSFQHPIGIAENMLVEVGRPFLHTDDVVIRVKQKQLNLGVGTKRMTFSIDSAMKHSYSNDDTYFSIDVIDEILEED